MLLLLATVQVLAQPAARRSMGSSRASRANGGAAMAWGDNTYGQSTVPAGLSLVSAISPGGFYSLALGSTVATTTTTLTSGANPSTFGQSVTFTATVASGAGTPAGTVEFFDGITSLGTSTLDGGGIATLNTATLIAGTHSLTAVYAGAGNYAGSTSSILIQVVNFDTEPNNNYSNAQRVNAPGTVLGSLGYSGDIDYFRLILPGRATLTPPTGLRYFLYIYNQVGQIVAQSTLAGGATQTCAWTNPLGAGQYCYAVVRAPAGVFSASQPYSLTLNW